MSHKSSFITGWDIGGAHLKVARINSEGTLIEVKQFPCPLWLGIDQLHIAIQSSLDYFQNQHDHFAITMTGELVDIFVDRPSGVGRILDCVTSLINSSQCQVYAGNNSYLSINEAKVGWRQVASQNWQASAYFVAHDIDNGLCVDLGSSTCDIIPIIDGKPANIGFSDYDRQSAQELLYTGTIRTPLIALAQQAPFKGQSINIAAELFATSADVWCLMGLLDPTTIQDTSADGEPWSTEACMRRIARLIGADANEHSNASWLNLARWFALQQTHLINQALLHITSKYPQLLNAPIITAGIGHFIIAQSAHLLNHDVIAFHDLIPSAEQSASDHAPAVAVALLALQQLT
jgi:probable H4MPT-linked C1 transfer pathway protein